jgi:hypothetical protein
MLRDQIAMAREDLTKLRARVAAELAGTPAPRVLRSIEATERSLERTIASLERHTDAHMRDTRHTGPVI